MFSKRFALRLAILGVVVAALVIGAIAWLVQFLPSRHRGDPVLPTPDSVAGADRELLRFRWPDPSTQVLQAVWERDEKGRDTGYELEMETNAEGHHDFPFRNVLGAPVEMGIVLSACDCTSADVCFLPAPAWQAVDALLAQTPWAEPTFAEPPQWHTIRRDDKVPLHVPADAHGLMRIHWVGRNAAGSSLKIHLVLWARPVGEARVQQALQAGCPVRTAPPLLFEPAEVKFGDLGPGETRVLHFTCWSPTRDHPDVSFQPRELDPLYQVQARPLSAAECVELQARLRGGGKMTRVRAGFDVKVTIHERTSAQQMDQGTFRRTLAVMLDELAVDSAAVPTISGSVVSEVRVGGFEDQNRVQLGTFAAAEPKVLNVPAYTDAALALQVDSVHPACLQVEVKRHAKGSTAQQVQWDLRVTVPANSWTGPLPQSSVIVLRIPGEPPRRVRIPVTGTASR